MTEALYRQAVSLLEKSGIEIDYKIPASADLVHGLELRWGLTLPLSYKAMLRDYGIFGFGGKDIYGLGRTGLDGKNAPSVVFVTETARAEGEITKYMVQIMSSGYGP